MVLSVTPEISTRNVRLRILADSHMPHFAAMNSLMASLVMKPFGNVVANAMVARHTSSEAWPRMQCTCMRTSYGASVGSLPATPTPDSAMLAAVTAMTKPSKSIPFVLIFAKTNESFKVAAPASCLASVGAAISTGTGSRRHSTAWVGGLSIADAGMNVRASRRSFTSDATS